MNIEFKCPQCGNAVVADETYRGHVVECPHCTKGIVVPKNKERGLVHGLGQSGAHIQCPHCGTEYEATLQDMHHLVSCEICGKKFVAGNTARKQSIGSTPTQPITQAVSQSAAASRPTQMPRSRPFIAIGNAAPEPRTRKPKLNIWIIAVAACLLVMLTTALALVRHGGKSNSSAKAAAMTKDRDSGKAMKDQNSGDVESRKDTISGIGIENTGDVKNDFLSELTRYAEQGIAEAQLRLGLCYAQGKGTETNLLEAARWLHKAAEQNNADAQYCLGLCYYRGNGVEKDIGEAVKLYRKAAIQGHALAQHELGICYVAGLGVEKDLVEGAKWVRKAAEKGLAKSEYLMGVCFAIGRGVEKDTKEAVKWYRKAAEQGLAEAQHDLGTCYLNGEGVEEDEEEAVVLFRKAAEQGHPAALYDLGKCYYNGFGVDDDAREALRLFSLAADKGHEEAKRKVQYAIAHQKSDAELIADWNVFRDRNRKDGDLDYLIARYCCEVGVWDWRYAQDVIRNSLRKGRRLDDMPREERREYMKGSEFLKTQGVMDDSIPKNKSVMRNGAETNVMANEQSSVSESERRSGRNGFAGHKFGERFEGMEEADPRMPRALTLKLRLGSEYGPFAGFYAQFGYTPKSRRLAYVAICDNEQSTSAAECARKYKDMETRLQNFYRFHGEMRDIQQYDVGSAFGNERSPDREVNPWGIRLDGVIYGVFQTGGRKSLRVIACVADIKLLNALEDELVEIQDEAIAKLKSANTSATLQSFCGIRFGVKDNGSAGGFPVVIDGTTFVMPIANVKCNRFLSFPRSGSARIWTSTSGNIFCVKMEPDHDVSIGIDLDDGSLKEEAQKVIDVITAKYGRPFLLKGGSRYNVAERRMSPDSIKVFMFPVGYSSIYLYCASSGNRGLYCINDIWARKAKDEYKGNAPGQTRTRKTIKYVPLNKPYKPTKTEQTDIDDADRESARLRKEQKKYYEERRKNSPRR